MNSEKNLLERKNVELIDEGIEQSASDDLELTEKSVSSKSAAEAAPDKINN